MKLQLVVIGNSMLKWLDQFRCRCTDVSKEIIVGNDPYEPLDTTRMVKEQLEDLEYLKRVCDVSTDDSTVVILAKTADVIRRLRGE